ncbi:MAG TPA: hypothetical protein VJR29_05170 [bacterium]|nr:hypothetical protein [bacterium]
MGRIFLSGPDGQERSSAFFGVSTANHGLSPEIADDGTITELEVSDARERLEEEINRHICGYGGPLGLGGWGGISEVCVQPWNMGGPARENTPDGYSMPITVRLTEDYRVPFAYVLSEYRSVERTVTMTARWEAGRVRLYQCEPPAYSPPPPPEPAPDPSEWIVKTGENLAEGARSFFGGLRSVASMAGDSLSRFFS